VPDLFPYQRVVDDLRKEIVSGRRAPGERLPSEAQLASLYSTSRPTVRRAMAVLRSEGLILTEQGRGAFVRPTPNVRFLLTTENYRRHRDLGLSGFDAQVIEQGLNPEQRIVEVSIVAAPADVSPRLDLDESAPCVVRRRLFLVDEQPVATCDSYYPAAWAEGTAIAEPANIAGGVHSYIEDPDGPIRLQISRSVDDLIARMPTPLEALTLGLTPGVPVVRILKTVYGAHEALEVQDTIAAADRHQLRYEVSMR
jgi:GntR family transcriptional regulator